MFLGQTLRATHALGDSLAGQLEMHTAEVRVHGAVDLQGLLQLGQDVAEAAGLDDGRGAVAVGGGDGSVAAVAVHGVALPDDDMAGVADRGDVGG